MINLQGKQKQKGETMTTTNTKNIESCGHVDVIFHGSSTIECKDCGARVTYG